jgi:hypothetical protein
MYVCMNVTWREWRKTECPRRSSLKNWRGRPRKGWKAVESDFQVPGVRRWRKMATDMKTWQHIVRQAKAHSGL